MVSKGEKQMTNLIYEFLVLIFGLCALLMLFAIVSMVWYFVLDLWRDRK